MMFKNESKYTEEMFFIVGKRKGEDNFRLLMSIVEGPETDPEELAAEWRENGYTDVDFHCISMNIVIDSTTGEVKRIE